MALSYIQVTLFTSSTLVARCSPWSNYISFAIITYYLPCLRIFSTTASRDLILEDRWTRTWPTEFCRRMRGPSRDKINFVTDLSLVRACPTPTDTWRRGPLKRIYRCLLIVCYGPDSADSWYFGSTPSWHQAATDLMIFAPSSATVERVFLIFTNIFSDQLACALEDCQASFMMINLDQWGRNRLKLLCRMIITPLQ